MEPLNATQINGPKDRRSPIWLCVMINLLAFPGLGTVMAGRRAGYPQAILMVTGFVLTMGYMLLYLAAVVRYLQNPAWSEAEFRALYRPYLWALWTGLGLCAVAWIWALSSSLTLWKGRNAQRSTPQRSASRGGG